MDACEPAGIFLLHSENKLDLNHCRSEELSFFIFQLNRDSDSQFFSSVKRMKDSPGLNVLS